MIGVQAFQSPMADMKAQFYFEGDSDQHWPQEGQFLPNEGREGDIFQGFQEGKEGALLDVNECLRFFRLPATHAPGQRGTCVGRRQNQSHDLEMCLY